MTNEELVSLYRMMLLIRYLEDKAGEMYAYGRIGGFLHLYIGEEAVAVGAIPLLRDDDDLITHYRDHGYAIARGIDPKRIMAELFGKATGTSKGKGGSMHLCDAERHFWGGYAIVGGHLPLACGLGLAAQYQGQGRVVLAIFGDGATNGGEFHEAMNMAALWKLPVVFLCENNFYAMGTHISHDSAVQEVYRKAAAYDMPSSRVDGMDVLAVREAAANAIDHARSGQGPYLLEAVTYRFRGHSMADPEMYRSKEEVEEWRKRDPITQFRDKLMEQGVLTKEQNQGIEQEVTAEIDEAVRFAEESPEPPPEALYQDLYSEPVR